MRFRALAFTLVVFLGSAPSHAAAQGFDNRWYELELDPFQSDLVGVSSPVIETDLAWGDLDGDDWIDLVVARKQPFTTLGQRSNVLLMNMNGVLVDRTPALASASDVELDSGFLTPTNDRDVVLADLNLDGALDVVTAVCLGDGLRKELSHPRVYVNTGHEAGSWAGLRHESSRIPQLFSFQTGLARAPRFLSVAAGDVTNDGLVDLFFGDHDSSQAGGVIQPLGYDLNDRLLINAGSGFFEDQSQSSMTTEMLNGTWSLDPVIADFNLDGSNDVMRLTTYNSPKGVYLVANDPLAPGGFTFFENVHMNQPYSLAAGDLNGDGRLDIAVGDDHTDLYRLNLGNDAFGLPIWSEALSVEFLSDDDDGFAGNPLIVDLDSDGRPELLMADIDTDIQGTLRRLHIYHNTDNAEGELQLLEEREQAADAGWVGVVGLGFDDLRGTHDIAVADFDRDGNNDLVISRSLGTFLFDGRTDSVTCQTDLGFAGPGILALSVCGPPLFEGNTATVLIKGAPAGAPGVLGYSTALTPMPLFGGTLVVLSGLGSVVFQADALGNWESPLEVGPYQGGLYMQAACVDPTLPKAVAISNAVGLAFNP